MATAAKGVTKARPKSKGDDDGKGKEKAVETPTQFGSHKGMANEELTGKIAAAKQNEADAWVILTDERGTYATQTSRLDTGMADPNRFADLPAREQLVNELTAQ
jgi:hypothetical protein